MINTVVMPMVSAALKKSLPIPNGPPAVIPGHLDLSTHIDVAVSTSP